MGLLAWMADDSSSPTLLSFSLWWKVGCTRFPRGEALFLDWRTTGSIRFQATQHEPRNGISHLLLPPQEEVIGSRDLFEGLGIG